MCFDDKLYPIEWEIWFIIIDLIDTTVNLGGGGGSQALWL
jgi:hypothetical protein